MAQAYWLRRQREELAVAGCTTSVEAKLIHLDLAGRYSVKADEEALWLRTANGLRNERPLYLPSA